MKQVSEASPKTSTFLLGHALSADWEQAVEQCLQQIGYIPDKANLGFLYVTDGYAGILDTILNRFRTATGIQQWTGTVGMGICATGQEYYDTSAMVAMIGSFPEHSFTTLPQIDQPDQILPADLLEKLRGDPHVGVIHGNPHNGATPDIISNLATQLPNTFLVGGLTSSNMQCPQIADRIVDDGVSGVVFSTQVPIAIGLTQGCSPIAGKHLITQCERNVIMEIDKRPALDVFFEDIGEILARDLNRIAGYIFAGLPVAGSDTSDYLVRNLVGIDTQNKLLAVGELLETGQTIQFCRRDGRSAWEDLERMLSELKGRIQTAPKGGLYFTCLGRGRNLFGDDSEELRAIRDSLGDFPLAGFFANGEINNNRLYGYTGVLMLFL